MKSKNMSLLIILLICAPLSLSSAEIQFVDMTTEAGINFRHINGAEGAYHLPETLGAGGAFFDADNDGNLDIYLVNSGYWKESSSGDETPSALYRNSGDGTFTDITMTAGVGNSGNYGQGAACADYDNDGDVDLYVTNFGVNVLYRNNSDGTFTDVTALAGTGDPAWSSSACFLDYNRDGHIDLFVVNYLVYSLDVPYRPCGEDGIQTYCHPSLFEGAPDTLYRNNGDGTFTDVSHEAGVGGIGGLFHGKGLGVVSADFNNDGTPDLYVASDDTRNDFFITTVMERSVKFRCSPDVLTVSTALHKQGWVLPLTITTVTDGSIFSLRTSLMKPMRFTVTMVTGRLLMSFMKHISVKRVTYSSDSAQASSMLITMVGEIYSSLTGISSTILKTHTVS